MKTNLWLLAAMLSWLMVASCGGYGNTTCTISAAITPATATADHTLAPPGNQAQFSLTSSVKGNCPYIADSIGVWSSSDPTNVPISSQGLATCNAATSATISNSSTVRGHAFTSATLTCK
jgi:hypothetical protein